MGTRNLISPDGRSVVVDDSNLQEAANQGYRAESLEEMQKRELGEQPLRAGVEGALRGVTVGLSDPFMKGMGAPPSELAGRKEENPNAALGGEAAGLVGGLFIPGGPVAGIAKAGKGAEALVGAGTLAGKLAAGAVEGSLFGLGTTVSEDALGNPQTNAQKIAAVTGGALAGAALNGITHGVGQLAQTALTKALGGETLSTALSDLADNTIAGKLFKAKDLRKEGPEYLKEAVNYGRENKLIKALGPDLKAIEAHREEIGAQMGKALRLEGLPDEFANTKIFNAADLEKSAQPLIKRLENEPGSDRAISFINDALEKAANKPMDFEAAWNKQSIVNKKVKGDLPGFQSDVKEFGQLYRDEVLRQAEFVSPTHAEELQKLSGQYKKTMTLQRAAEDRANQEATGNLGLIGNMLASGGALYGGPAGFAKGAALGYAQKFGRDKGSYLAAAAMDKLGNAGTLDSMASVLRNKLVALKEVGGLGAYQPILENASARGAMDLLATHVHLAKTDPNYLPSLGLQHEDPAASKQYAEKAERLGAMDSVIKAHDAETAGILDSFLTKKGGGYSSEPSYSGNYADFQERMKRIHEVMTNPAAVDTSALAATAPQLALGVSQQAVNAATFLDSKAPKSPYPQGMKAFEVPWEPSPGDLERFYRYSNAVERPQDVLKELNATNSVSPEAAEALRIVYPQLLEEIKQKMMDRLQDYGKPLEYEQKRGLSAAFGVDFVGENPQQLALLQQLHSANVQEEGEKPRDGRQTHTQEDNLLTQAQRTTAGRSKK